MFNPPSPQSSMSCTPAGSRGLARKSASAGFTLVEVVTVVMIIAILMAASTTAISGARKTALRTHSRDTVRQLAAAWTTYVTDQGSFPEKKDFDKGMGGDVFAASPKNIGGLLNTQYHRKSGKTDYSKPRSDSITYFATTREECEPKDKTRKLESWPDLNPKQDGARGVCDRWHNVVYFALDFDLDGKVENPIGGATVTASALAYSTGGHKHDEKTKYGKNFLVAY